MYKTFPMEKASTVKHFIYFIIVETMAIIYELSLNLGVLQYQQIKVFKLQTLFTSVIL